MKKKLLFTAAAAAIAACPVNVYAVDPEIWPAATITSEDWLDMGWIYGSNLMYRGKDGVYTLMSTQGERLSDVLYDFSFYGANGLIAVRLADEDQINGRGVVDDTGKEVLPCMYGQVDISAKNWIIASVMKKGTEQEYDLDNGRDYLLKDTVDIYYQTDGAFHKIATLTRDDIADYYASGNYISIENGTDHTVVMYDSAFQEVASGLSSIYDDDGFPREELNVYWEDDKTGIKDAKGNIILETDYDMISEVYGKYASVYDYDSEKYGLIDLEGNEIVPLECDDIRSFYTEDGYIFVSAGYVCAEMEGKLAYYDLSGNKTAESSASIDSFDIAGASALMSDAQGNNHIFAADGVDTVLDAKYANPCALTNSNGLLYTYEDADSDYGIIDWHGNVVLPAPQGYSVGLSLDGSWLVTNPDYNTVKIYRVIFNNFLDNMLPGSEDESEEAVTEQAEAVTEQADALTEQTDTLTEQTDTDLDAVEEDAANTGVDGTAGETDLSAVKSLIDTALTLVNVDFEGNQDSILALLNSAKAQLADQPAALSILDSVLALINSGAADASSVASLLQSISVLLS